MPNNAQLELTEAVKKRTDSDIILAIQLEDGKRVVGNFNPNEKLINVLTTLCPESLETSPVVIYTRREIYGEALNTTTLKNLGLTGGRAMIRLIHKTPEELKMQANVSAPLPSKPVEEKPYYRKPVKANSPTKEEATCSFEPPKNVQKNTSVDLLKLAREKRKNHEKPLNVEEKRKTSIEDQTKVVEEVSMEVDEPSKQNYEDKIEDDFVFVIKLQLHIYKKCVNLKFYSLEIGMPYYSHWKRPKLYRVKICQMIFSN